MFSFCSLDLVRVKRRRSNRHRPDVASEWCEPNRCWRPASGHFGNRRRLESERVRVTLTFMDEFELPAEIQPLLAARDSLRRRYASSGLRFTLDGNLVGDIGEAVAAELFGIELSSRCGPAIDGFAPGRGRKSVQVKASGTFRGPAFRKLEVGADHLLFFHFDFDRRVGTVIFNGPERIALEKMPGTWTTGQRTVPLGYLRQKNAALRDSDRLPRITGGAALSG